MIANQQCGQDQATDNESKRRERSAETYPTGIPSTLWGPMCMSETVISLVWVSKKIKTLSEMQDRPTTTHYSTSSSTNKQETMRFLNKQCFFCCDYNYSKLV